MLQQEQRFRSVLQHVHPEQFPSAANLLHYLALRNEDIRDLQDQLHILGLSSLASAEGHIHQQLQAILQRLGKPLKESEQDACTYSYSRELLKRKAEKLFGEKKDPLTPFVMVTMDASFADDYSFIKTLLQNGMNIARINCAHDDEVTWSKIIQQIKRAMRYTGLPCKIYMDLAGPKLRTRLINKGAKKGKIKVEEGERIWLAYTKDGFEEADIVISPGEPGLLSQLQKGERVYMDDGVIKGEIEWVTSEKAAVRIIRVSSVKRQIKNDKGINFPDSLLNVQPLTDFDKSCLPFICSQADMTGYSFIRNTADLALLQTELRSLTAYPPAVIIKIETPDAVENLPALLLQGMKEELFGVMIARGDLAVEIGFERMGEIQEEILWICEAAHAPVIWATQVLESLNKTGMATRSEITDVSHAAMAECIMINKGDHTIKVIETLHEIVQRMGGHHIKKRYTFRPLNIARNFLNQLPETE